MGKTSSTVKNRYNAKAYDRIEVVVPKGQKEAIKAHAAAMGESVNAFIFRAITQAMEKDKGEGEVRSHWTGDIECYLCGEFALCDGNDRPVRSRFCPHCGAPMDNHK